jgi:hypothetical protein
MKYKIVKYTGALNGWHGVHEIEDQPHQGSGVFVGTYQQCKDKIKALTT